MNYSTLNTALKNRVGFRQVFATKDYLSLDADLTATNSGLVINSISEVYLRPEVVDQFLEFAEGLNIDAWDNSTNYGRLGGSFIFKTVDGKSQAFVSKVNSAEDNVNKDPETESDFWETFLSYRLKQYRQSAIAETVSDLATVKFLSTYTHNLKNYDRLFHVNAQPQNLEKSGSFRCLNVIPNDTNGIALQLTKVGLILDTAQTVRFYLYHSDNLEALQTFDVDVTEVNKFVWYDLTDSNDQPLIIGSLSDQNAGGQYFFGFYEDDITGNIKSWEYNYYLPVANSFLPGSSGYVNYLTWKAYQPYYAFYAGLFENVTSKPNIPEIGQYFDQGSYDEEIPFNVKLKISEDHTNVFLDNVNLLDKLIQLKWAILILTDMKHTFRKNSHADKAEEIEKILNRTALTEGTQGSFTETVSSGIIPRYNAELKQAKKQLQSITTSNWGLIQTL